MDNLRGLRAAIEKEFGVTIPTLAPPGAAPFVDWHVLGAFSADLIVRRNARIVALSGCQGSGKSTLAQILAAALVDKGRRAIAVSVDDFYLPQSARAELGRTVHPLLITRGVPGTHDTRWLGKVLAQVHSGAADVQIPRFDKGQDDRREVVVEVGVDVLILEGWCVGVTPQPEAELVNPCNALEAEEDQQRIWRTWVNQQIAQHYLPLWEHADLWLHLRPPGFSQVLSWRTQAEQQLPVEQRMTRAQMVRFVAHYERLTRWQQRTPARGPGFLLRLDAQHNVDSVTVANRPTI